MTYDKTEHETAKAEKKLTLTDKIYNEIREDIAKQVFLPGEKINIKELARKYNVSDTPVKQALQRLVDDKIVVNTPNKGMSLKTSSPTEMNDIFDMRLLMDTHFAKDVIATINYSDSIFNLMKENLEKQIEFMSINSSAELPKEFFSLDMEFHTYYLMASGNKKAVEVLQFLHPFNYSIGTFLNQSLYRDKECVEEHQAIFDAIANSDLEGLKQAIAVHIENSRRAQKLLTQVSEMV